MNSFPTGLWFGPRRPAMCIEPCPVGLACSPTLRPLPPAGNRNHHPETAPVNRPNPLRCLMIHRLAASNRSPPAPR
jgi:hypothetical protein